jgi:hypothetical protein
MIALAAMDGAAIRDTRVVVAVRRRYEPDAGNAILIF